MTASGAKAHVSAGEQLIGDALFLEPALRALAESRQAQVVLHLLGDGRTLYRNHPLIRLAHPTVNDHGWIKLSMPPAFAWAASHRQHICAGVFPQLGLNPSSSDVKPVLHRRPSTRQCGDRGGDRVVALAPFSRSCSVHTSGIPNKTIALAWWESLAMSLLGLGLSPLSFGSEEEATMRNADNWRGRPLEDVVEYLAHCRLLIGGDTGLTAIAGALNLDIVLLSAAVPAWLTGPQTHGKFENVVSRIPPRWTEREVLGAVERIIRQPPQESRPFGQGGPP
jgi:hypothetical protein